MTKRFLAKNQNDSGYRYLVRGTCSKSCLFIGGSSSASIIDSNIITFIESNGWTVLYKQDNIVVQSDSNDKDIILISDSSDSSSIDNFIITVDIPIFTWDGDVSVKLDMSTGFSTNNTKAINIQDTNHPITDSLSNGNLKIFSSKHKIPICGGVENTASQLGKVTNKWALYVYDSGSNMVSISAAAKRAYFGIGSYFDDLNSDGLNIFNDALEWLYSDCDEGGGGEPNDTFELDCNGTEYDVENELPPMVLDCNGECGGNATLDCLGVCNGDAVLDCNGECNGPAFRTCDGVCLGIDCQQVNSYNKVKNICGKNEEKDCKGNCYDPTSEKYPTYILDCNGECDGDAVLDCNGECNGTAIRDCAGICNGNHFRDSRGLCLTNDKTCKFSTSTSKQNNEKIYNVSSKSVIKHK